MNRHEAVTDAATVAPRRPLVIAHVLYRFAVGGLENGVVNLINRLPAGHYRHIIICVSDHDPEFARRLQRQDVEIHDLHKPPGRGLSVWWRCYWLLRRLRPDLVHTRNLSALEAQLPAFLAGVPRRVHSEHGYDSFDPDGSNKTYQRLRRWLGKLVHRFIPLSRDLERYLRDRVGIPAHKLIQLYNGVDLARFDTALPAADRSSLKPGWDRETILFGTVGRLQAIKDQPTLIRAFARLREQRPIAAARLGLVLVGDGPLRGDCERLVQDLGIGDAVAFAGERGDVPTVMRTLNVFVLPSRAEGISNTILEAMACGLPVVATDVGGNGELVAAGETGLLVPPENPEALATAMARYLDDPLLSRRQGRAGRARVESRFSLETMLQAYDRVYQDPALGQG